MAFFCEQTGVRIVAPGVCKSVDPIKGHDECDEPSDSSAPVPAPQSAAPKAASSATKEK